MNNRKIKSKENDENCCPTSQKKRLKISKNWKLSEAFEFVENNKAVSDLETLRQMGIDMLESDETSSSSVQSLINPGGILESAENEITPSLTIPAHYHHHQYQHDFNDNNSLNQTLETEHGLLGADDLSLKCQLGKTFNNNKIDLYSADSKYLDRKKILIGKHQNYKSRSPLATVICNNNNNVNINQRTSTITSGSMASVITTITHLDTIPPPTTTTSTPLSSAFPSTSVYLDQHNAIMRKPQQILIPDENFFLYRNADKSNSGELKENPFNKLSDEITLQIFKWLPKKTLVRCSFVCRKFNQLAQDESLWTRLDLGGRTLRSGALGDIISRGVVVLRLAQAEIADPVFDPERLQLCPEYQTKLQYLDLSMAVISKSSLRVLLSKCNSLKKLSLEHVPLNDKICDEIAKNTNLESLNLTMCEGIEQWSIKKIMKSLQQLQSLNISWTFLNVEAISSLVENLTPNLLRLNLSGCRKNIFDSHITTLTKRCSGLLELDLSDCTGLTSNAVLIVCKFKDLNYLSLSRCYGISASCYVELNKLPSLSYLDVFGILSDSALQMVQNTFPSLGINKFIHSCVARPTVGTRRTSIWGLRTRD